MSTEPSAVAPGQFSFSALLLEYYPALSRSVLLILVFPVVISAQSVCNRFRAVRDRCDLNATAVEQRSFGVQASACLLGFNTYKLKLELRTSM